MSTNHNRIKVSDLEKNQPNKILATNSNGELEFSDVNFVGSDTYNDLDYTFTGKALDARQGKVLKDLIDNINALLASDNVNLSTLQNLVDALETVQNSLSTILVNDLTTGGATKALTAEMGKTLQSNKVDKVAGKSLLTDTEITRLGTLSNYTHPANHPPSIITQDPSNRFVTDAEKATWNAKQSNITAGAATQYFRGDKTWQTLDKTAAGLSNVDNTADAAKNVLSASKLTTPRTINGTAFDGSANVIINAVDATPRIASSEKGVANGVATLDASGIILTTQLPSYVDDVLEFINLAGFPASGETGKIYVTKDTNKTYRWGGTAYVYITSGAVDSVSGKTGIVTLAKADVGLASVDNTADAAKNVLSASKLTTTRTINNVAFDGSANITINAVDTTARIASSEKGVANGVATLDSGGIIPTSQLPSYVDDVLEFVNLAGFPASGETGKIYVAKDTNKTYRWGGTAYVYITSGAVDSVSGKTGVVTLTKADVGLTSVDNTADAAKNVLSASKLTTPRTINGVSFNGSANIAINAVDATPRIASSEKGAANGVATLDASGIIPTTQLPSYVDDVLEFINLAGFPTTGETGKIYVAKDTNKTYRWGGTAYVYITSGAVDSVSGKTGIVTLAKADVGLASVDNTADAVKNVLSASKLTTPRTINNVAFDGSANITINAVDTTPRIASSEKGAANGVATLDASGIIPTTQLPSYVDDVLEFINLAGFPTTGETGKIYVAKDTNKTYRWGGTAYVYITSGAVDSVSGRTGVITLTKNDVGLSAVDNTSDLSKPLSTSMLTALNTKQATLVSGTNIKTVNGTTLLGSGNIVVSIPSHIEYNTTDLTLWNNGKGNIATNTTFGEGALKTNTSGMQLVAVGASSLLSNTTGYMSTAIGSESLKANTSGYYNTAVGTKALLANTTGGHNVAIGTYALQTAVAASRNIAIGTGAMERAISGDSNIAIGNFTLSGSNTGSDNIAIGDSSLAQNTTGKDNTSVGRYSLWSNTTGIGNTGFGYNSLNSNTTGVNNVASGKYSLAFNKTGSDNIAIGYSAGQFWGGGTSNPNIDSSNSIYIGSGASGLAAAGFSEIVIGYGAVGAGNSTTTIGNPWITKTILRGQVSGGSFKIDAMNSAPASATATGTIGEIRFTTSAIYVCIATNTWVKSALTTW